MPRKAIDYSRTIFYKLCCKNPEITNIYVGHTTDFIRRKQQHKDNCNAVNSKKYNYYVYQFIRENGGWNNFDMIVLEQLSCENKYDAELRERYWLEELKASLNKYIPTRTKQEYHETNREQKKERDKEYREQNREKISEKKKEKIECECGSNIRKSDLARHRKTKKHLEYLETIE